MIKNKKEAEFIKYLINVQDCERLKLQIKEQETKIKNLDSVIEALEVLYKDNPLFNIKAAEYIKASNKETRKKLILEFYLTVVEQAIIKFRLGELEAE